MNISVVLPTYKRLELLRYSIASILPQLEEHDELLILIDGAQDPSFGFVSGLAQADPRVRVIIPSSQASAFDIYRMLFEAAVNDMIVMVHDDEIYHSELLKRSRQVFEAHPRVTFQVGGQIRVRVSSSGLLSWLNISYPADRLVEGSVWVSGQLRSGMIFNCSCLVFRRNVNALAVLHGNQLSADNLFAVVQAAAGQVMESSFVSSTWLLHATNTSLRDFLKIGHEPLWRGLDALRGRAGFDFVDDQAIEGQKLIAKRLYLKNAFAAAAVDGNRPGYLQCIRYASEAGKTKVTKVLSLLAVWPSWPSLCFLMRCSKKIVRRSSPSGGGGQGLNAQQIADMLRQPPKLVKDYLAAACPR